MGSTVALSYANLYAGLLEVKWIYKPTKNPFVWGDTDELEEFTRLLNQKDPNLKFSMEYYFDKVHFLDMWVEKNSGELCTII